ncbi:MAG: hypothetical protein AB1847_19145 [bacterium]
MGGKKVKMGGKKVEMRGEEVEMRGKEVNGRCGVKEKAEDDHGWFSSQR